MICTYNQTQKTWTTPFDEPVTFLCGDLALCEGHLYTRTVIKPREEYELQPCTSDDLRAIMTEGLTSGSVVFSGSYAVQELLNIFQIPAKKKVIPQSGHGHRKGRFLSAILSYAGIFFEKIFLENSSKTTHPLTDSFTSLIITKDNYL